MLQSLKISVPFLGAGTESAVMLSLPGGELEQRADDEISRKQSMSTATVKRFISQYFNFPLDIIP